MAQAMFENNHEYFRQFQKQFRYYITNFKPNFDILESYNYIYEYHPSHVKIDDCQIKGNHYHIICDKDIDFFNVAHPIPCLVNCFYFLLKPTIGLIVVGSTLLKLQTAVTTLPQLDPKAFAFNTNQKRLPKPISSSCKPMKRLHDEEILPKATCKRLKLILDGSYAADFYKLMDIFVSGEGVLDKSSPKLNLKVRLNKPE